MPHADISMVANNSDSWFNSDKKVDRDRDGVDDRAEGAGKGAGIGAGVGGTAGLLAGLGLLAIPGLGPVVPPVGWLPRRSERPPEQPPVVLLERSPKPGSPRIKPIPMPKVFDEEARWYRRGSRLRIVLGLMDY